MIHFHKKKRFHVSIIFTLLLFATLWALDKLYPPKLDRLHDVSTVVYDKDQQPLHVFCSPKQDLWCLPVQLDQVDPGFLKALIEIEDRRFWSHWGVDPLAMLRAVVQMVSAQQVVSGGSTLTMQTVRLLEPRPRTVTSKVVEMLRAWQLEWRYGKSEILQMYLTLAPYGGNVTGVRAASMAYFGHGAERLTPAEAAMLVALPRSPSKLRPDVGPMRLQRLRNRILKMLQLKGYYEVRSVMEAQSQDIPRKRFAYPRQAPHLARRMIFFDPKANRHQTFIDSLLQQSVASIVHAASVPRQTANIAVLVVENHSQQVQAYIGSRNFWSVKGRGQVDYVQAVRSPGSTLKPFVYGLGFEYGLIHPDTVLKDLPRRYGAYCPSNFNDQYYGDMTVAESLRHSLNTPVIMVLSGIGAVNFVTHLQQTGVHLRLPPRGQAANLTLALGGLGMSLEELVLLYSSLGQHGQILPLHYSQNVQFGVECQLLSGQATHHLVSILNCADRFVPLGAASHGSYAIKTGTSHGHRDAWALGVSPDYTVGVWVGCPDNTPLRGETGLTVAVPILKKVFQALPAGQRHPIVVKSFTDKEFSYTLKHQVIQAQMGPSAQATSLRIQFPVSGTSVQLQRDAQGTIKPLSLMVSDHRGEVTWLVNGHRVDVVHERNRSLWIPPGVGFYSLVATDALGQQDRVEIEVEEGWS